MLNQDMRRNSDMHGNEVICEGGCDLDGLVASTGLNLALLRTVSLFQLLVIAKVRQIHR